MEEKRAPNPKWVKYLPYLLIIALLGLYAGHHALKTLLFRHNLDTVRGLVEKKRFEEATRYIEDRYPSDAYVEPEAKSEYFDAYVGKARALLTEKRFADAKKAAEQARKLAEGVKASEETADECLALSLFGLKQFSEAARVYENIGKFHEAFQAYVSGNYMIEAADLAKLNKFELSPEVRRCYLEAGKERSGKGENAMGLYFFKESGLYGEAMDYYLSKHQWEAARQIAFDSKDPSLLGKMFEALKDGENAIQVYLGQEDHVAVARVLGTYSSQGRCYSLVLKKGWIREIADFNRKHGYTADAVKYYLQLGDVDGAVGAYVDSKNFEKAGVLLSEHQRWKEAATLFERGKRYGWAAKELLRAGENELFADLALRALVEKSPNEASNVIVCLEDRAQRVAAAAALVGKAPAGISMAAKAQLYSGIGEEGTAALLYEQSGDKIRAFHSWERVEQDPARVANLVRLAKELNTPDELLTALLALTSAKEEGPKAELLKQVLPLVIASGTEGQRATLKLVGVQDIWTRVAAHKTAAGEWHEAFEAWRRVEPAECDVHELARLALKSQERVDVLFALKVLGADARNDEREGLLALARPKDLEKASPLAIVEYYEIDGDLVEGAELLMTRAERNLQPGGEPKRAFEDLESVAKLLPKFGVGRSARALARYNAIVEQVFGSELYRNWKQSRF